eukprot:g2705.t1
MFPVSGQESGGTVVRIYGTGFRRGTICRFGTTDVHAVHVSSNEIRCASPQFRVIGDGHLLSRSVEVHLSTNGVDFLPSGHRFTYERNFVSVDARDDARAASAVTRLQPSVGSTAGGTLITVHGDGIANVEGILCAFGSSNSIGPTSNVEAIYLDAHTVQCYAPRHIPSRVFLEIGTERTGFTTSAIPFVFEPEPVVYEVHPSVGPASGVEVSNNNRTFSASGEVFVYHRRVLLAAVSPSTGPSIGGTSVVLKGAHFLTTSFHFLPGARWPSRHFAVGLPPQNHPANAVGTARCRFGDRETSAIVLSAHEVTCRTPASLDEGRVRVQLSLNGIDFEPSQLAFTYYALPALHRIWPATGPAFGGGRSVTAYGAGFRNIESLSCRFGSKIVPASFLSSSQIVCSAPPGRPGIVSFEVSNNGLDFSSSELQYYRQAEISLAAIFPRRSLHTGNIPVFVSGANFANSTSLSCRFGDLVVRATLISENLITCIAPSRVASHVNVSGLVPFEVTNNGLDFSRSGLTFEYVTYCPSGSYCPQLEPLTCPNGTYCPGTLPTSMYGLSSQPSNIVRRFNFTLCPPGTFQPRAGQSSCAPCPIGFICPDAGLSSPVVCPAGYVCDVLGLRTATTPCPEGHFCGQGTKSTDPDDFVSRSSDNARLYPTARNGHLDVRQLRDGQWLREPQTGQLYFDISSRSWAYQSREDPETGRWRPEHPPAAGSSILAERPVACPLGFYCRAGAASNVSIDANFSTPQRCFDGFFCPHGSNSPEGSGPCPTAHYCPSPSDAITCPAGHFCPNVGNTEPMPCVPGTYNPIRRQSRCTLCPRGHVCPEWAMTAPEICPAGFICNELGLSVPFVLCPPGYYCPNGTSLLNTELSEQQIDDGIRSRLQQHLIKTADGDDVDTSLLPTYEIVTNTEKDQNTTFLPLCPKPCRSKTFCLGGVAHTTTIEWLPTQPEGAKAPQKCLEGTYCVEATATITAIKCLEGHYCPPGVDFPVEAPLGSFTGIEGTVSPTLCFPGTYAPLTATKECRVCPAGYSCKGYGTYIPEICAQGEYRSADDGVTCRMCPTGTWSPFDGLEDLSLCEPCPEGRICGINKMSALQESSPCPDGYACADITDETNQFANPCPAGFVCDLGTKISDQYSIKCEAGHFCNRATSFLLKSRNKCQRKYFCPEGTPSMGEEIRCPRSTKTAAGMSKSTDCQIESVRVCDKIDDPVSGETAFYYPAPFTYRHNGEEITINDEVQILRHIDPIKVDESDKFWHNDTVVVYRVCPDSGWERGGEMVTVIGKNFRKSPDLRCLWWRDWDEWMYETPATWINDQYVECETPPFPWWECDETVLRNTPVARCISSASSTDGESKQESKYRTMMDGDTVTIIVDGEEVEVPKVRRHGMTGAYVTVSNGARFAGEVTHSFADGETGDAYDLGYSSHLKRKISSSAPLSRLDARYSASFNFSFEYDERCAEDQTRVGCSRSESQKDAIATCLARKPHEKRRHHEHGWFQLQGMNEAHVAMDLSRIPNSIEYGSHFRIAFYVAPSVCEETQCEKTSRTVLTYDVGSDGPVNTLEVLPCRRPLELPTWFRGLDNDRIHDKLNFTVLALEDVLFKVEIQIVHGSFLSTSLFFENTTVVRFRAPLRSFYTFAGTPEAVGYSPTYHVDVEKRRLACVRGVNSKFGEYARCVSPEEEEVPKQYFFTAFYTRDHFENFQPPLNLPPRYKAFERGRVLLSLNVSQDRDDNFPEILDDPSEIGADSAQYWSGQKSMSIRPAQVQDKYKYRETFDSVETEGDEESLVTETDILLPYIPFFSNCHGYDSYIPISTLWESDMCELPHPSEDEDESGDTVVPFPRDWWRRQYPPLLDYDDVVRMDPYAIFSMIAALEAPPAVPVADWCTFDIKCAYEENVGQNELKPRWFEADNDDELFSMFAFPVTLDEYMEGKDHMEYLMNVKYSEDYMIPVIVDRTAAEDPEKTPFLCVPEGLCFPRTVTFEVMYFQVDEKQKRIITATLIFEDFDKDVSRNDYTLSVVLQPMNWVELLIQFAFETDIYLYMFVTIGMLTVMVTVILWAIARLVTRLANPPPFRFFQYMRLIAPPALNGFVLASLPIIVVQLLIQFMLRLDDQLAFFGVVPAGSDLINWESMWVFDNQFGNLPFDHIKRHYMDEGPVGDEQHALEDRGPVRYGRVGISLLVLGTYLMMQGAVIFLPKRISKREREIELKRNKESAEKQEIWFPTHWKRANFLYTSGLCVGINLVIIEFSFWEDFGDYFFYILVIFMFVSKLIEIWFESQLKEALLIGPLAAALGLMQGAASLGSDDFQDFVIGYMIDYGLLVSGRLVMNDVIGGFVDTIMNASSKTVVFVRKVFKVRGVTKQERDAAISQKEADARKVREVDVGAGEETVEPIMDNYNGYC